MLARTTLISLILFATTAAHPLQGGTGEASDTPPSLSFPLACTLGTDCWIGRYLDRGEDAAIADYQCGTSSQDKHKGTDIMVADLGRMEAGVPVLAAADGTVLRRRGNMPDISVKDLGREAIKGKECGNAMIIDHGNGWQTQYCHLKEGSLRMRPGEKVQAGDIIAEVGLSGETEYPHLHFMVRHGKQNIDPFDGGMFEHDCSTDRAPLWKAEPAYMPVALLPGQLLAGAREGGDRWQPAPEALASSSPALLLAARMFHVRAGDILTLKITAPDGTVFLKSDVTINRDRQFFYQYTGRKRPSGGFEPGTWTGDLTLVRHGTDIRIQNRTTLIVTP